MPKFVIIDADAFDRAVIHRAAVTDMTSAVEAVPNTTDMPQRVYVVPEGRMQPFFVVNDEVDGDIPIIYRAGLANQQAAPAEEAPVTPVTPTPPATPTPPSTPVTPTKK